MDIGVPSLLNVVTAGGYNYSYKVVPASDLDLESHVGPLI